MSDLVHALTILLKYGDPQHPTCCAHDELIIVGIDPAIVSDKDRAELEHLGFSVTKMYGYPCFHSYRFGSA